MNIVVFGGAGFIGTNICLEAISRGYNVIAFDNLVRFGVEGNVPILEKAGVQVVRGDVRNTIDFDKLPWIPDALCHLAGQPGIPYSIVSPFYDFEVNARGTLNILEYAKNHGKIPVIFASTNKVYTNITNDWPIIEKETRYSWSKSAFTTHTGISYLGINENTPLDAFGKYQRTPYGASKVAADLSCQEYYQCFGVPTVVNRMSCVYGYYQKGVEDQAWVSWFMRKIVDEDGKITIFGTGKQVRDMLWGGDCARLYLDELEHINKVKGKVYNIGGGRKNTMSLIEVIQLICKISGKKWKGSSSPKRYADQDIWISDITRIKEDLGWEPKVSPEEGIRLMYQNKL